LNLLFSVVAAVFSLISGLLAKGRLTEAAAQTGLFESHQNLAFLIIAGITGLFLWRSGLKGAFPSRKHFWYLLTGMLLNAVIFAGAYFGGRVAHL